MNIYCGRQFSEQELLMIRQWIAGDPSLKRAALSRLICDQFDWRRPTWQLKDMCCRVALLRMEADGLIQLPPSQMRSERRPAHFPSTTATDPQTLLSAPVHDLPALRLLPVANRPQSRLWNEYVQRYHYLGYTPLSGSQIRYNILAGEQLVALLSFGASAWKLAAREHFIGWDESARSRNLQLVVNNARFLILPWIKSKGLASRILALAARRLPNDWNNLYGYSPVLLETFVEAVRHRGTCYKAANWIQVGQTTGRGKKCSVHTPIIPVKDIWLYPLRKDFKTVLHR